MKERTVPVARPDGAMETFVVQPEGPGPWPAVIVYMDIWGIREELRDIARGLAVVGYQVLLPDLYYRQGKVANRFGDHEGRMLSFERLDEQTQKKVLAPMLQLTTAKVAEDTAALIETMDHDGAIGCVGYCLGGRLALCMAGLFPERIRASASLHGTNLVTDAPDSPHRLAKAARGEILCGHGEKDKFSTPAIVRTLEESFRGCDFRYHSEVHEGADHGYALPDRDVYDKHAVLRDWEIIHGMFRRQLPS
jgi:carboxymethylenebutenolidase